MLVKARKTSMGDRISKRPKSCLGNSTFRPTSFIRFLFPVLLLPRRTLVPLLLAATLSFRSLPISSDRSLSRGHDSPFPRCVTSSSQRGLATLFDDSFVPALFLLLVTLLSH